MKRTLLATITLLALIVTFSRCKKNEPSTFDYPLETLYGTWRITHVEQKNGVMLDVTTYSAEKYFKPTYATFNEDGTYSGRGYFGNGSGTYKAQGKTITCYIDGSEYVKYDVLSLSGQECELKMKVTDSDTSSKIRCKKQ